MRVAWRVCGAALVVSNGLGMKVRLCVGCSDGRTTLASGADVRGGCRKRRECCRDGTKRVAFIIAITEPIDYAHTGLERGVLRS